MTHPRRLPGAALALLPAIGLLSALAGCAAPLSHGDRVQLDACRARAEQVYSAQNREDVYLQDSYVSGTRDTPFAGAGSYAATSTALSGRFARERMVDRCMRGAAGNVGSTLDAPDPTQPTPDAARGPTHPPRPEPLAVPPTH